MKRSFLALTLVVAAVGSAQAIEPEYCSDFEPPIYSPGLITGQDDWYVPVAGSVDFVIAPYGGSIAPNPNGGSHYAIGTPRSNTEYARAQHDVIFDPSAQYTLAYDVNVQPHGGTPPAANNIGSFSLQNSASARSTQSLFVWDDLNNPAAGWSAQFLAVDAAGANSAFVTPGPEFTGLAFNTWYRNVLVIDFATNEILSMSITDIAANTTTTVSLTGRYLTGGADNVLGLPMPDGARLFTGGDQNNTVLWDNLCLEVVPAPATGMVALLGLGALSRRRRN